MDTDEQCGCPREGDHTFHFDGCPEQCCACEDTVEGAYRTLDCVRADCPMYGGAA